MPKAPVESELFQLYNGEVTVKYYPNAHRYTVVGEKGGMVSPSQLSKYLEDGDLSKWYLKMCKEYFLKYIENHATGKFDRTELLMIFDEALNAGETYSHDTIVVGEAIHALCETFAKSKIEGTPLDVPSMLAPITDERVINGFMQFADWYQAHDVQFIQSERVVYSQVLKIAGRLDAIARVDGKVAVIDYKTGSLRPKHVFQTAAYWIAYEEEAQYVGWDIPEVTYLLNFHRDGNGLEPFEITREMHDQIIPIIGSIVEANTKVKEFAKSMKLKTY